MSHNCTISHSHLSSGQGHSPRYNLSTESPGPKHLLNPSISFSLPPQPPSSFPKLTRQPLSLSFAPRLPPLQLILKHQPDYAIPLHKSFNSFLLFLRIKTTCKITQHIMSVAFQASISQFILHFFPKRMQSLTKNWHILPGITICLCWIPVHFSNGLFWCVLVTRVSAS